ncbi:hypothetical protein, partial [Sinorhizobium fredii]
PEHNWKIPVQNDPICGKHVKLEARRIKLTGLLADYSQDVPYNLPTAAALYTKKIAVLTEALNRPEERQEAGVALRLLIHKIVLTPGPKRGDIDANLQGELGTIMTWIAQQNVEKVPRTRTPGGVLAGVSLSVVAGA